MKKQGSEAVDLLSLPQPKKHKKKLLRLCLVSENRFRTDCKRFKTVISVEAIIPYTHTSMIHLR
jgi:hypothetical protein